MSDLRDKLSLGFLKQAPASKAVEQSGADFLAEAVMLYGARVLQALAEAPGGIDRVHHIVRKTDISIGDVLQVVTALSERGYIEVRQEDKLGNQEIALTDRGRKAIG